MPTLPRSLSAMPALLYAMVAGVGIVSSTSCRGHPHNRRSGA